MFVEMKGEKKLSSEWKAIRCSDPFILRLLLDYQFEFIMRADDVQVYVLHVLFHLNVIYNSIQLL